MPTTVAQLSGGWVLPLFIAGVLHLAGGAVLGFLPAPDEASTPRVLHVRLPLPVENSLPMIIVSADPIEVPPPDPEPTPQPAPVGNTPAPVRSYPEEVLRELAEERERLKAELDRARAEVAGVPPPAAPPIPASEIAPPRQGSLGTIRELDLAGPPDHVVQDIMSRYRLKVTVKAVAGGSNQSFLSSAASQAGDRFVADRSSPAGIYQVFELSKLAVAKMSKLEEDEIRSRGHDPETANVHRIKFGIVQTADGYDLGVTEMEMKQEAPQ